MNIKDEVVFLYVKQKWTLRRIARRIGTDRHNVKRILKSKGVEIDNASREHPSLTKEHRRKIGESSAGRKAWNRGKTMDDASVRKNMRSRMRTSIDLGQYPDTARLKILTHVQAKRKKYIAYDDATRKQFLDKFYFDRDFNAVYDAWIASGKNRWMYPSLEHKTPLSRGGDWALSNLSFVTWFENRAKADMTEQEWNQFKHATNTKSDLFR
jgi:hypothetical protein